MVPNVWLQRGFGSASQKVCIYIFRVGAELDFYASIIPDLHFPAVPFFIQVVTAK